MALNDDDLKARMNRFVPPTAAILGQEILEIDSAAGRVKMKFQPIDACRNPMGNVQGGIVVAMLDAAKAGVPLYAEGRCLKLGKRIAFMEADLFDEEGTLLARLTTSAIPIELDGPSKLVDRQ